MSALADVAAHLTASGVPFAGIGAVAVGAYTAQRSTAGVELLVVDLVVLERPFWAPIAARGHEVVIRKGDAFDPLAGLVRIGLEAHLPVDVVVGGAPRWQAPILARARPAPFAGVALPLATAADLVRLKVFAGGPRDRQDVEALLASPHGERIREALAAEPLPKGMTARWRAWSRV